MEKRNNSDVLMLKGSVIGKADEEVNYRELLYKFFLGKWYLYAISLALCLGLTYIYIKKQQSVYGISSKLLIRESKSDYSPEEDWLKRSLSFSAVSENVANEIQVLTSFSLMHTVVEELGLETRYYWKHRLSEYDAYKNFPIVVDSFSLNPVEKTHFQVTPIDKQTFKFSQDDQEIGAYQFGQVFSNAFGTFRIQKNGSLPAATDSTMNVSFSEAGALATSYLDKLKVELSDEKNKSSVLLLSLKDEVPQRGVDIMNRLVQRYNQLKSQENTEITFNSLEFIGERIAAISSELKGLENSVEEFKMSNDIASETTADLNIILNRVDELVEEQRNIELQIGILDSMKIDLQDTSGGFELIPVNLSLVNNQVQELVKPYNELVLQRQQLLLTGQPSNPVIQSTDQRLSSMRSSIYSAIDNMRQDLRTKLAMTEKEYNRSLSRLRSVPAKEKGLSDKLRKQSITENLYVYLLQKREETALALVSNHASSVLVDPPHSTPKPIGPNKMLYLFGGTFAGIGIPLGLLLLLGLFKDSVRSEKELKKVVPNQPIVGVINHHRGKKDQMLLGQNRNMVAERFRTLRTNIQFHYREKTKCIMVTSSTSDEGKTFVASNLATSFAMSKKKTIIIDFDLRKPDMGTYFAVNPEIGMSSFLIEDLEIDEVIQVSKEFDNLHYIGGGPVLDNPPEWITEEKLKELFSFLRAHYDIIIIDTSPVGIISDAILLNNYVDHSLYVVRSGYTKKVMIEKAREFFDDEKLTNPHIILNGVKKENDVYGYSYKKYGYTKT